MNLGRKGREGGTSLTKGEPHSKDAGFGVERRPGDDPGRSRWPFGSLQWVEADEVSFETMEGGEEEQPASTLES